MSSDVLPRELSEADISRMHKMTADQGKREEAKKKISNINKRIKELKGVKKKLINQIHGDNGNE